MDTDNWIATYAAIVATGALALEIRRWFESGPKLVVRANSDMLMVHPGRKAEGRYLMATVVNRGEASTTITNFGILEFPSAWSRWRRRPAQSFIVVRPEGNTLPHKLEPGAQWMGVANQEGQQDVYMASGKMWVAIYTTDRERPYVARIPKRKTPVELEGAKSI